MARQRRVTIDALPGAIMEICTEYFNDADKATEEIMHKATQTARAELRATSPKKTGKYARGWQYRKGGGKGRGCRFIIYNGSKPGLTHLLEKGHAVRGGGRAPAHPHIAPVEQKVCEQLPDDIKTKLSGL